MQRTKIVDVLKRTDYGVDVNIKGWVRTRRGNKNVSFIALNDGSTIHNIQIVVDLAKLALRPTDAWSHLALAGADWHPLGLV